MQNVSAKKPVYFLSNPKGQSGPYTELEILTFLKEGTISIDAPVWCEGMVEPQKISSLSQFQPKSPLSSKSGYDGLVADEKKQMVRFVLLFLCFGASFPMYFFGYQKFKSTFLEKKSSDTAQTDTQTPSTESSTSNKPRISRDNATYDYQKAQLKAEMDRDANIVCRAYSAQARAVEAFNQYVRVCNSMGAYYSD